MESKCAEYSWLCDSYRAVGSGDSPPRYGEDSASGGRQELSETATAHSPRRGSGNSDSGGRQELSFLSETATAHSDYLKLSPPTTPMGWLHKNGGVDCVLPPTGAPADDSAPPEIGMQYFSGLHTYFGGSAEEKPAGLDRCVVGQACAACGVVPPAGERGGRGVVQLLLQINATVPLVHDSPRATPPASAGVLEDHHLDGNSRSPFRS